MAEVTEVTEVTEKFEDLRLTRELLKAIDTHSGESDPAHT
jgi:hypothetical protein